MQAVALVVVAVVLGAGYYEVAGSSGYKSWLIRAFWSIEDKDYPAAITILEKTAAADPHNAEAEAWLGQAYELNHERDKAIVAYKKALELDPGLSEVKDSLDDLQRQPEPASGSSTPPGK